MLRLPSVSIADLMREFPLLKNVDPRLLKVVEDDGESLLDYACEVHSYFP